MAKTEERQLSEGILLDPPHVYDNEDARIALWKSKWPNAEFALVHVYNKNGTENRTEVYKYEAIGYQVLSEDKGIVQHPGHVLMGVNAEWNQARKQKDLDRFNRGRKSKEVESANVGDVKDGVVTTTTREDVATFDDIMRS